MLTMLVNFDQYVQATQKQIIVSLVFTYTKHQIKHSHDVRKAHYVSENFR